MSQYLSPINDQQFDANGNPLVGGKIYTYIAGSSTPAATYTDNTGVTQQANPIILNALGVPTSPIWLSGGTIYKIIIQDSAGVTLRTVDNLSGINDVSASASEWTESGFPPTYIGPTSFSMVGDKTALMQVNRRIRTRCTSGYVYGRISVSTYLAGITTVTVVNDSTAMDSGLSLVAYSFLSPSPNSIPYAAYAAAGANTDITSLPSIAINSKIQPVTATVAANALTLTLNPTSLDFRSTTLTTGVPATVTNAAAITLVISSGSTLGTTSAQPSRVAVLAINNGGTMELAACNAAGFALNEVGLISTTAEGGAGAADSATVVYSTTARTSVAYRVVGFVDSTQTTAGTWAVTPTLVQGSGGQALTNPLTTGTAVATTSGVSIDFTGIPSWAKRITVMLSGVSSNGVSPYMIQIGAGSIDATGYLGASALIGNGVATGCDTFTTGFGLESFTAATVMHGTMVLTLMDTNKWTSASAFGFSSSTNSGFGGGSKTLSGTLDRLRLTTVGGVNTFDAGQINIMYEG